MRRIRTIKPEWLEDDRLVEAGSDARVLSIALILMADDHGRGRLNHAMAGTVFPLTPAIFRESLAKLSGWYVREYEVRGQRYYEIVNWKKHQRVDRPGNPKVPPPESAQNKPDPDDSRETRESVAKNRESHATDQDQDQEGDQDHSHARAHAHEAPDPAAAGEPAQGPDPQPPPLSPRKKLQADIDARVRSDSSSPGGVWQLLCDLSELHCRPDGRPILIPGVMASPKDLSTLERLYAAAEPIAAAEDVETLAILAEEWLALLALVDAGECEVKSRPLGFFASRFTRLREARDAYGATNPPPRILEAVA